MEEKLRQACRAHGYTDPEISVARRGGFWLGSVRIKEANILREITNQVNSSSEADTRGLVMSQALSAILALGNGHVSRSASKPSKSNRPNVNPREVNDSSLQSKKFSYRQPDLLSVESCFSIKHMIDIDACKDAIFDVCRYSDIRFLLFPEIVSSRLESSNDYAFILGTRATNTNLQADLSLMKSHAGLRVLSLTELCVDRMTLSRRVTIKIPPGPLLIFIDLLDDEEVNNSLSLLKSMLLNPQFSLMENKITVVMLQTWCAIDAQTSKSRGCPNSGHAVKFMTNLGVLLTAFDQLQEAAELYCNPIQILHDEIQFCRNKVGNCCRNIEQPVLNSLAKASADQDMDQSKDIQSSSMLVDEDASHSLACDVDDDNDGWLVCQDLSSDRLVLPPSSSKKTRFSLPASANEQDDDDWIVVNDDNEEDGFNAWPVDQPSSSDDDDQVEEAEIEKEEAINSSSSVRRKRSETAVDLHFGEDVMNRILSCDENKSRNRLKINFFGFTGPTDDVFNRPFQDYDRGESIESYFNKRSKNEFMSVLQRLPLISQFPLINIGDCRKEILGSVPHKSLDYMIMSFSSHIIDVLKNMYVSETIEVPVKILQAPDGSQIKAKATVIIDGNVLVHYMSDIIFLQPDTTDKKLKKSKILAMKSLEKKITQHSPDIEDENNKYENYLKNPVEVSLIQPITFKQRKRNRKEGEEEVEDVDEDQRPREPSLSAVNVFRPPPSLLKIPVAQWHNSVYDSISQHRSVVRFSKSKSKKKIIETAALVSTSGSASDSTESHPVASSTPFKFQSSSVPVSGIKSRLGFQKYSNLSDPSPAVSVVSVTPNKSMISTPNGSSRKSSKPFSQPDASTLSTLPTTRKSASYIFFKLRLNEAWSELSLSQPEKVTYVGDPELCIGIPLTQCNSRVLLQAIPSVLCYSSENVPVRFTFDSLPLVTVSASAATGCSSSIPTPLLLSPALIDNFRSATYQIMQTCFRDSMQEWSMHHPSFCDVENEIALGKRQRSNGDGDDEGGEGQESLVLRDAQNALDHMEVKDYFILPMIPGSKDSRSCSSHQKSSKFQEKLAALDLSQEDIDCVNVLMSAYQIDVGATTFLASTNHDQNQLPTDSPSLKALFSDVGSKSSNLVVPINSPNKGFQVVEVLDRLSPSTSIPILKAELSRKFGDPSESRSNSNQEDERSNGVEETKVHRSRENKNYTLDMYFQDELDSVDTLVDWARIVLKKEISPNQPLLLCRTKSTRIGSSTHSKFQIRTKRGTSAHTILIPELAYRIPITEAMHMTIKLLPAVLPIVEHDIAVASFIHDVDLSTPPTYWPLRRYLSDDACLAIFRTATTEESLGANSYQVMEFFGDSILKYAIALTSFMSSRKSPLEFGSSYLMHVLGVALGNNKKLFQIGSDKRMQDLILSDKEVSKSWTPPGFPSYLNLKTTRKNVADIVESVSAAFYCLGGMRDAFNFLHHVGYSPIENVLEETGLEKSKLCHAVAPNELLLDLWSSACRIVFDTLEANLCDNSHCEKRRSSHTKLYLMVLLYRILFLHDETAINNMRPIIQAIVESIMEKCVLKCSSSPMEQEDINAADVEARNDKCKLIETIEHESGRCNRYLIAQHSMYENGDYACENAITILFRELESNFRTAISNSKSNMFSSNGSRSRPIDVDIKQGKTMEELKSKQIDRLMMLYACLMEENAMLDRLEESLGYSFASKSLGRCSLRHSSYAKCLSLLASQIRTTSLKMFPSHGTNSRETASSSSNGPSSPVTVVMTPVHHKTTSGIKLAGFSSFSSMASNSSTNGNKQTPMEEEADDDDDDDVVSNQKPSVIKPTIQVQLDDESFQYLDSLVPLINDTILCISYPDISFDCQWKWLDVGPPHLPATLKNDPFKTEHRFVMYEACEFECNECLEFFGDAALEFLMKQDMLVQNGSIESHLNGDAARDSEGPKPAQLTASEATNLSQWMLTNEVFSHFAFKLNLHNTLLHCSSMFDSQAYALCERIQLADPSMRLCEYGKLLGYDATSLKESSKKSKFRVKVFADTFEAVFGAICIDSGLNSCRSVLMKHFKEDIRDFSSIDYHSKHPYLKLDQFAKNMWSEGKVLKKFSVCNPSRNQNIVVLGVVHDQAIRERISETKRILKTDDEMVEEAHEMNGMLELICSSIEATSDTAMTVAASRL